MRSLVSSMTSCRPSAQREVVHLLILDSEDEQVEAFVKTVRRLRAEGASWNSIAVLVRSVVKSGKPIVDGLIANGIPVQWPILNKGGPFIDEFLPPVFSWLHSEHPQPKSKAEAARAEQQATRL